MAPTEVTALVIGVSREQLLACSRTIAVAGGPAKLAAILEREGRVAEQGAIDLLARLADGGMRDAESMLDQLLSSGVDPLRAVDVEELLGLPNAAQIEELAAAILDADAARGVAILAEFEMRGRDPRVVAERLGRPAVVADVSAKWLKALADQNQPF